MFIYVMVAVTLRLTTQTLKPDFRNIHVKIWVGEMLRNHLVCMQLFLW